MGNVTLKCTEKEVMSFFTQKLHARDEQPARLLLSVPSRICSNADIVVDECERETDSTWRHDVTKLPFDRDEAAVVLTHPEASAHGCSSNSAVVKEM